MEIPTAGQGRRSAAVYDGHHVQLSEVARRTWLGLLLCALGLLSPPALAGERWSGRVVGVKDGDTLEVLKGRTAVVVRLNGVDCPELHQPFGRQAKEAASTLSFNKTVTVVERTHDRYRRIVADILLPGGENLSNELLKRGLAWWYRKYAPRDQSLRILEESARDRAIGLWTDPGAIPPWAWRKH